MAIGLVDFDGCGDGDRTARMWSESSGGSPLISTAYGTFGGYGFWNTSTVSRFLPGNYTNLIHGAHIQTVNGGEAGGQRIVYCENGTVHVAIAYVFGQERIRITHGNGAEIHITPVGSFPQLQWGYVEAQIVVHDTAGIIRLWLFGDSTPFLELTGLDTKNGGSGFINNIKLWNSTNYLGDGFGTVYYDDMYWVDGNVPGAVNLGPCRITKRSPIGDGTPSEWDPDSGVTHWTQVDELPFDITSWVQTNVNGEKDMYTVEDDGITYNIYGVRIIGQMRKNDVLAAQARLIVKDGANFGNGNVRNLSDTSVAYSDVFPERPAGAGNWNEASVDAMQIGVEKVT